MKIKHKKSKRNFLSDNESKNKKKEIKILNPMTSLAKQISSTEKRFHFDDKIVKEDLKLDFFEFKKKMDENLMNYKKKSRNKQIKSLTLNSYIELSNNFKLTNYYDNMEKSKLIIKITDIILNIIKMYSDFELIETSLKSAFHRIKKNFKSNKLVIDQYEKKLMEIDINQEETIIEKIKSILSIINNQNQLYESYFKNMKQIRLKFRNEINNFKDDININSPCLFQIYEMDSNDSKGSNFKEKSPSNSSSSSKDSEYSGLKNLSVFNPNSKKRKSKNDNLIINLYCLY